MTNDNDNAFDRPFYGRGTAAGSKGKSGTSKAGAESVQDTLGPRQAVILERHRPYGPAGATPCQIASDMELDIDLVRPRITELALRNLLFPVGKRLGHRGRHVVAYSVVKPSVELDAAA